MTGGRLGPDIIPGDPDHSLLVRLIRHQGPASNPMPMPPRKPQLSPGDIDIISSWIRAGAAMPPNNH